MNGLTVVTFVPPFFCPTGARDFLLSRMSRLAVELRQSPIFDTGDKATRLCIWLLMSSSAEVKI